MQKFYQVCMGDYHHQHQTVQVTMIYAATKARTRHRTMTTMLVCLTETDDQQLEYSILKANKDAQLNREMKWAQ